MTGSNFPRVLTTEECEAAFKKYMPTLSITPIAKGRMWKASMVLHKHKYADLEDLPFELFQALSEEELNLQAQWKIVSCYHAIETGKMDESEGFMWIETMEWCAYEVPKIPDEDGAGWPYILMLGYFDDE